MGQNKKKIPFYKVVLKRIAPTFLVAFLLPFIVGVCVPFEVFGNNLDEFYFSVGGFLPTSLLLTLAFTLVIMIILIFLPGKIYRVGCAFFIALALMFFVQGTYLNGGMSSLAGDNLGVRKVTVGQKIFNLAIWIIVIGGAIFLSLIKDKNGVIGAVSLIVCVIVLITQLMSPVMLAVTSENIFKTREERIVQNGGTGKSNIVTFKNLNTISQNGNVFFFCVDRFDQEYALKAYNQCPEVFDCLEGFIGYDDNISIYGHTFPGVANLLTTKRFDLSKSRSEYLNTAYSDNKTLDVLDDNGYKVNIYTAPYYSFTDASFLPEYVDNVAEAKSYDVVDKPLLSLRMMQIALYRCFPLILKNTVGAVNSGTCNSFVVSEGEDGYMQYTTDMKEVYTSITDTSFNTVNQKIFSFIHLDGCHSVDYDEEWNKASIVESTNVMISLKNSFKIIKVFIDQLKANGLYDDATIIITGDHGTPVNDTARLDKATLTALFFKPKGRGVGTPLERRVAQVSHDNIWSAILESEGLTASGLPRSLLNVNEDEKVKREHFWHTYMVPTTEYKYEIFGAGKDFANWEMIKADTFDKFIMD